MAKERPLIHLDRDGARLTLSLARQLDRVSFWLRAGHVALLLPAVMIAQVC